MQPRVQQSRHSAGTSIALLYAAGVLAWNLARFTPVAEWWVFAVLDVFGIWLFLPLPLLLAAALAVRDSRAGAWLVLPLALFLWEYGALFLPHPVPREGTPLRAMTSNLLQHNDDVGAFVATVTEHEPDVVAVQELRGRMADNLGGALRARYPHQALHSEDRAAGMGMFSRHPIRAAAPPEMGRGTCYCQRVTIEVGGHRAAIINVHPMAPEVRYAVVGRLPIPRGFRPDESERGIREILERTEASHDPLIVLGDFNTNERQPAYRLLRGRLHNAWDEVGWGLGYTWPNRPFYGLPLVPLVRIDHIFYDDAWSARSARAGSLRGSDHRYVVADLLLR